MIRLMFSRRRCTALLGVMWLVTACGKGDAGTSLGFDGKRALRHVERLVAFGPRPVGSEALAKTRAYITHELESLGLEVGEQPFSARTPLGPKPMVNVQAILRGQREAALALSAHYESKLFVNFRFVGANDSASAVGVLLELARVLAERQPQARPFSVWFLFFDGEEALLSWSREDSLYGSRHFVRRLKGEGRLQMLRALINLDMIGDRQLDVVREQHSTPWLRELVWKAAAELGHSRFFNGRATAVQDDHAPFLAAGIPALDLIDFTYGMPRGGSQQSPGSFWHTPNDTLDKLSPKSLQIIGETVLHSLPRLFEMLDNER